MRRFNLVDENVIEKFTGPLKTILELELKAGNKIVETYESKDSTFPMPNAVMIFLGSSFKTPVHTLKDIEYHEVNDPHYWKAEYFDPQNRQFLCCKYE